MMSSSGGSRSSRPLGLWFLENRRHTKLTPSAYRALVLIVTFFTYASYHATRKGPSIVKSVLDPKAPDLVGSSPWTWSIYRRTGDDEFGKQGLGGGGWAPFNGSDGTAILGDIDVAFLAMYSIGMFFAGHLGDRLNLRILLTVGMLGTGAFTALFGAGYWLNIHNFHYYLVIQMVAGIFQSTGWPSVVAVMGNWFQHSNRGLIMGIWNAHTSVGNIFGSLIAAGLLKYGWGWSFAVPGLIMGLLALVVFLLLPVSPEAEGIEKDYEVLKVEKSDSQEPLLEVETATAEEAVGFFQAWKIPGVAPFALCLFFSKLVAYTFLYWLPFYISQTPIDGKYLSDSMAGTLSTLFDVGGIIGGILAGHISDYLQARAITAASFIYCAIPALLLYRIYGSINLFYNIIFMFSVGIFVNGPYALITTAVSADLGTHSSLNGNSRALATVTAIIDGIGSVGAAIGPLLTGYISAKSWGGVFMMLMGSALVAGLLLTKLVMAEVTARRGPVRERPPSRSSSTVDSIV